MVEPDFAEPIWKTRAAFQRARPVEPPVAVAERRWRSAAEVVGADRGVDQVAAVVLGGPLAASVGATTASHASDKRGSVNLAATFTSKSFTFAAALRAAQSAGVGGGEWADFVGAPLGGI